MSAQEDMPGVNPVRRRVRRGGGNSLEQVAIRAEARLVAARHGVVPRLRALAERNPRPTPTNPEITRGGRAMISGAHFTLHRNGEDLATDIGLVWRRLASGDAAQEWEPPVPTKTRDFSEAPQGVGRQFIERI